MRPRGGYIGFNRVGTTTAASGVWTVREAESLRRAGEWPRGPLAPTGLTAAGGSGQLSLSWTAPATTHGAITNYLVEYTASGGSAQYVLTNSTSTSYTLTGLTNGTLYTVRVAAVNFTAGDYSATASGTAGVITPSAPRNVVVTQQFGYCGPYFVLSFDPPVTIGSSPITSYRMRISLNNYSTYREVYSGINIGEEDWGTGVYQIDGTPARLSAVNSVGEGPHVSFTTGWGRNNCG